MLAHHGKRLRFDAEARDTATKIVMTYAGHPLRMESMGDMDLESHSAASVALAGDLLQDFGVSVVKSAQQVRNLVTNKLIVESDNPDPKVRLKALEMLGKISDVGLFTEKSEVTITHTSDNELRRRLREKLKHMKTLQEQAEQAEDAIVVEDELQSLGLPAPETPPMASVVRIEPRAKVPVEEGPFDDD
jgi:hypothetical protein